MCEDGFGRAGALQSGFQLLALAPVREPQRAQELGGLVDDMHRWARFRQRGQAVLQPPYADLAAHMETGVSPD